MVHACGAVPRYTCRGIRSARFCSMSLPPTLRYRACSAVLSTTARSTADAPLQGPNPGTVLRKGGMLIPASQRCGGGGGQGGGGILHDCTGGCKC